MDSLTCATCGATSATPRHCGRPMHIEAVDGRDLLVCWMGPGCGTQEIPEHCGAPMRAAGA